MAPKNSPEASDVLTNDEGDVIEAYRKAKSLGYARLDISILGGQRARMCVKENPKPVKWDKSR